LDWWKSNYNRFLILFILVKYYLAILTTSAAIESVFSISNNIIIKARNRLNFNLVSEITLLKSWIKDFKELENEYFKENKLD
ncbi:hypothetical protein M431DRAFT_102891, partial [Trichoderma harzianum CBS 226.95]